ncbi:dolichol kinase isoform X1 [Cotesia glomerata]|uniref:dolichol kinase isoform X1 n=2 Tax=Cotesia glomerata TaxID=32391 RepID=UPI001D026758|nr:dolichol kinase isoform X1 [Cotesia glomerata]XP_044577075.1 dolichol kinase isoform X1 [Cotesia glomerata]
MEIITMTYYTVELKILQNLEKSNIIHRSKSNSGLWLGLLMGTCALITFMKEDSSYSEICLLTGLTGLGLIMSCICLILQLYIDTSSKDFQLLYFLPASITSMLYLLWANKDLLVSVIWGLGVGTLSTWGVLQLMTYLPGCFTLGECIVVMHGVILFLLSSGANLSLRYHLPPLHDDDIVTTILQVGILYIGLLSILCVFYPKLRSAKLFYSITFGLLILVVIPVLHILLDQSPLLWMFFFVFGNFRKIFLIMYWIVCLLIGIIIITHQILSESSASTIERKTFHILAVLVYTPGLIWEPTLLYFASGIVMILFMMFELMRLINLPPLNKVLKLGFSAFVDEKDSLISLTPLYLHVGLSFPLWMPSSNIGLLPLISGVTVLGIGDSAASFIGSKYGTHKWPETSKTVEGTIACVLGQLLFIYGLAIIGVIPSGWVLVKSTLAIIAVSIIEARTNQVDNLALPLLLYIFLIT